MKYYDFLDKAPAIGKLVIIEGTERELADRALENVIERVLPADVRDMNLDRFTAAQLENMGRLRESVASMPFLATSRLIVLTDAQTLKAAIRREVWDVAQTVPEGNTMVISDLVSPRSQRPQPLGQLAGRAALRIDTTANEDVRTRFIEETLTQLGAKAEPRVVAVLSHSEAELASVRNDLEKLALGGKKITLADLQTESLTIEDPKAYQYAGALVEGRTADALRIAHDMFAGDRNAAIPMIYAVATETGYLWELAREGGQIPARMRWRERTLRPIAASVGEERARRAFERALAAFDSVVTGKVDDPQLAVELLTAELSGLHRRR